MNYINVFLTYILIFSFVLGGTHIISTKSKIISRKNSTQNFYNEAETILWQITNALEKDKTPSGDSFLDEVFNFNTQINNIDVKIESLNSRINVNNCSTNFLQSIDSAIISQEDINALIEKRSKQYILTEDSLPQIFTSAGYLTLNIKNNELKNYIESLTYVSENLKSKLLTSYHLKKIFDGTEGKLYFGQDWDFVSSHFNFKGTVNVNTASEEVLNAVICSPLYKKKKSEDGINFILTERNKKELTESQVFSVLNVDADDELFYILTSSTDFWKITFDSPYAKRTVILRRIFPQNIHTKEYVIYEKVDFVK